LDQPQLVVRDRKFDGEVSLPSALINQAVGGQSGQLSFKVRQGALVQAGEPDQCALSDWRSSASSGETCAWTRKSIRSGTMFISFRSRGAPAAIIAYFERGGDDCE
jgi:hypothetical protein